ncbi:MAG: hypothetical protein PUK04_01030 [Bacteroidales bacterium]|nr:hypothetical protein [Bacteroidales bacterium]MDY6036514.1 hypothetical protein [Paludibacteraceae bacterium]
MKLLYKIANKACCRTFCVLFMVALCGVPLHLMAQNNVNSPYTRYGYGRLQDIGFSRSQSMGGAAYALRTRTSMNPANPASNSSIDSTSFLFEFGASALLTSYASGDDQATTFTGNLEYLAFQLPITRWMGLSVGVLPYSFVGYNYGFTDSTSTAVTQTHTFRGSGGINQVYIGLAGTIWKRFSLGVNVYYMFGSIENTRLLTVSVPNVSTVYPTTQYTTTRVQNVNLRYGFQYHETIGRHNFCLGFVYDHISKLYGTYEMQTVGADTISANTSELFDLPSLYGAGVSYTYDNKLTIAFDYTLQEFAKARYYGKTDSLVNRQKFSLGAEYIYRPYGNRYVDRMRWRLGASYANSYFKLYDAAQQQYVGTRDISITCGVGFPLRTTKTMVNINLEYGNIGVALKNKLQENYFKIGINLTLNEMWFFKQRIQ